MNRILLVGMMGTGKTTVGAIVASHVGGVHLDSDADVVALTGHTVAELFAAGGEEAFRVAESEVLRAALGVETLEVSEPEAEVKVISVAGGAVLDPENRLLLSRSGTVVWLRARPGTIAERVGNGEGRPLLADDPRGRIEALDAVRRPLYAEIANVIVDVDHASPDEVADLVLSGVSAFNAGAGE